MRTRPTEAAFHVDVTTEIASSPERVWQVFTSFANYPAWNPAIVRVSGEMRAGAKLNLRVILLGFKQWSLRATVLSVAPNRELTWEAHFIAPVLFLARHACRIEPWEAGRVRFRQVEYYSGLLAPVLARLLAPFTRRSFEQMNQRLRATVEGLSLPQAANAGDGAVNRTHARGVGGD